MLCALHQYGILKYSAQDKSFDYNTSRVDVEKWARSEGLTDENLISFRKYSEDYFGKFAYDRTFNSLLMKTDYSKEVISTIAETMKILNVRYFAGTENLNSSDILDSEGYLLLSELSFYNHYALSISSDKDIDDNHFNLKTK